MAPTIRTNLSLSYPIACVWLQSALEPILNFNFIEDLSSIQNGKAYDPWKKCFDDNRGLPKGSPIARFSRFPRLRYWGEKKSIKIFFWTPASSQHDTSSSGGRGGDISKKLWWGFESRSDRVCPPRIRILLFILLLSYLIFQRSAMRDLLERGRGN